MDYSYRCSLIKEDYKRYSKTSKPSRGGIIKYLLINRGFRALYVFRMKQYHKKNENQIRHFFWKIVDFLSNKGVELGENAEIGPGLLIIHAYGISIYSHTIGSNCTIYQNATIGANYRRDDQGNQYPRIGDNVKVGPGAVIVGPINVGSNVVIGANAVVTKDVPSECIYGGVPARMMGIYNSNRFDSK